MTSRRRTWVGAATRIRFERHTELLRARDGLVLAVARTIWIPIDVQTRRPASVNPEVRAAYAGDEIVARTWVGAATRIRFERHTEVLRARDGCVLALDCGRPERGGRRA